MGSYRQFGKPRNINGKAGTFEASALPLGLISDMKRNVPIPITIGGTSNRTFTVLASATMPVRIWNGDDYLELKENLAYSWVVGTNATLNSAAAATDLTNGTTGVWYFYIGLTSAGVLSLKPSQTAPSFVAGPFEGPVLAHPGTSRTQFWNYVGFHQCDATTPTFLAATKLGYDYLQTAATTTNTLRVATTTTWTERDYSLVVPKHGPLGLTVLGELRPAVEGSVKVGSTATATIGIMTASIAINTTTHTATLIVPFGPITPTANGKIYSNHLIGVGNVDVTIIRDVV